MKDVKGNKRKLNKKVLLFCLIIVTACLAVYTQALFYGFTHHDDDTMITLNMQFIGDISNIKAAFLTDAWCQKQTIELYRPLQSLSYILDAQTGGNIAFATHLTNLILHILCCIVVFMLLRLLKFDDNFALIGALFYSVHYLFCHTVIWIPARGDLLLALFSFLSMITFIRMIKSDHWGFLILNVIFFTLALFSKETAILLPFIFLLYVFLFRKERIFQTRNFILTGCYMAIYLVYSNLRNISITKAEQSLGLTSLLLNLRTIPETIAKLFFPVNFSTMPFFDLWTTLTGIALIIGGVLYFILRRNSFSRLTVFAIAWFIFFLLPGMIYRPEFASYTYEYLDHRAYLPSLGILIIGLGIIRDQNLKNRQLFVFSGIFLLYLASLNFYFHRCYKNPLVFSESAIRANPKSSLAHFIHGNEIYKMNEVDGALEDFTIALDNYPQFYEARFNRAVILHQKKQYEAALEDLTLLLAGKPDYSAGAYDLRAIVKATLKDHDGAFRDFTQALKMSPDNPKIQKNFEIFKSTATKIPDNVKKADDLNDLGVEEARKGNIQKALTLFNQALQENPENLKAMENIGNCKDALGDRIGACAEWKKAAAKGSRYAAEMVANHCR